MTRAVPNADLAVEALIRSHCSIGRVDTSGFVNCSCKMVKTLVPIMLCILRVSFLDHSLDTRPTCRRTTCCSRSNHELILCSLQNSYRQPLSNFLDALVHICSALFLFARTLSIWLIALFNSAVKSGFSIFL